MKVLQINSVYNKGSTGKITYDLHKYLLENGDESIVCYGRGDTVVDSCVYKTCGELYSKFNNLLSRITGVMYGGLFFSTNKLISIIKKEKPDIVHLQCINGYFVNIYNIISWLKKSNIKTVLTLHAEFMYTANCGHAYECEKWKKGCGKCPRYKYETKSLIFDSTSLSWKKMKKAFDGFNNLTVVAVSPWLLGRVKCSEILKNKNLRVIYNGVDLNIFKRVLDLSVFGKDKAEKIIFHATPTFNNDPLNLKGGYYVLKLAEKLKNDNVKIVVAGAYDKDMVVPENVILLGRVSDSKLLSKYYSNADVTLLTSKRETFSMICAESLCCGTPVVGFKAGGPECIALQEYSNFVEYADVEALYESIINMLSTEFDRNKIQVKAHEQYANNKMLSEYYNLYQEILS